MNYRFKVVTGSFTDASGITYGPNEEAGAIVESNSDLKAKFPNKFVRLGRKVKADEDAEVDNEGEPTPEKEVAPTLRRRSSVSGKTPPAPVEPAAEDEEVDETPAHKTGIRTANVRRGGSKWKQH